MVARLIRTGWTLIVAVVASGVTSTAVIVISRLRPTSPAIDRWLRRWSRAWLRAAKTQLVVENADRVDTRRSYVIVSNHRSNLDIMANFLMLDVPIRFLAKKELFGIPLIGAAMRAIGMIEVDRQRGAAIHRELNESAGKTVQAARSIMVYPEGTRSRDGSMRPFKKGAFAIAIESQLPVVVATIHGSYRAWPAKGLVNGGTITVAISEPIETSGMTREDVGRLTERCRAIVDADYARLDSA